jgi:hypothetical protein
VHTLSFPPEVWSGRGRLSGYTISSRPLEVGLRHRVERRYLSPTSTLPFAPWIEVIARRHILHFNATYNPTAAWVIQQLREAFPYDTAPKYLILDRDAIFSPEVMRFMKVMGTTPRRISYRSPWQNPVAKRWIRELPPRAARVRGCLRPPPSRATSPLLHPLLSRGPLPPGAGQGRSKRKAWREAA